MKVLTAIMFKSIIYCIGVYSMNDKKIIERNEEQILPLTTRLNKIIGQINGIKKMIEENKYCRDVLQQVAAAEKALQSFAYIILEEHMKSCVAEKIKANDDGIISETIDIIRKIN